jgi:hypothetical protein
VPPFFAFLLPPKFNGTLFAICVFLQKCHQYEVVVPASAFVQMRECGELQHRLCCWRCISGGNFVE